ncbi:MAG: hypothetical protein CMJ52_01425, partial [Planctomycetaceae bacterium]|nr:hypothetical protein [Planctomycetaceae bacterium]
WRPGSDDMDLIYTWLRMSVASIENHLARTIISHMDWSHGVLSSHIQTQTGIAVVSASIQHMSETSPTISAGGGGSVAAMTHLAMASFSAGPVGQFLFFFLDHGV